MPPAPEAPGRPYLGHPLQCLQTLPTFPSGVGFLRGPQGYNLQGGPPPQPRTPRVAGTLAAGRLPRRRLAALEEAGLGERLLQGQPIGRPAALAAFLIGQRRGGGKASPSPAAG